jgi:hypothetical protein
VNEKKSVDRMYDVHEALDILNSLGLCLGYDLTVILHSSREVTHTEAELELCRCIMTLINDASRPCWYVVFVCPPYSVLVYKDEYGLHIVDTHPLPKKYGGNRAGAIISPKYANVSIVSLILWLVMRIATKEKIAQEFILLSPTASTEINRGTSVEHSAEVKHCSSSSSEPVNMEFIITESDEDQGNALVVVC